MMIQVQECRTADEVNQLWKAVQARKRERLKPVPKPKPVIVPIVEEREESTVIPIITVDASLFITPLAPFLPAHPPISLIKRMVSKFYNVEQSELDSARRQKRIVRPRHIAMAICKNLTLRSYPYIGSQFGGRDHTTALNATQKIERMRAADPDFDAEVAQLESEIKAKHEGVQHVF